MESNHRPFGRAGFRDQLRATAPYPPHLLSLHGGRTRIRTWGTLRCYGLATRCIATLPAVPPAPRLRRGKPARSSLQSRRSLGGGGGGWCVGMDLHHRRLNASRVTAGSLCCSGTHTSCRKGPPKCENRALAFRGGPVSKLTGERLTSRGQPSAPLAPGALAKSPDLVLAHQSANMAAYDDPVHMNAVSLAAKWGERARSSRGRWCRTLRV